MSEKWTDKVRGKLSDYEAPAPDEMWGEIFARVDHAKVVPVWRKVLSYAAYPAAAAVVAVLGFQFMRHSDTVREADTPIVAEWKAPEVEEPMAYDDEVVSTEVVPESYVTPVLSPRGERRRVDEGKVQELPNEATNLFTTTEEASVEEPSDVNTYDEQPYEPITLRHPSESRQRLTLTPQPSYGRAGQFSMGLYASNLPAKGPTPYMGYGNHFPVTVQGLVNASGSTRSMLKEDIEELNSVQETKMTTEYSMPIRLGLSLSYHLTDRLAIEGGLTATRMSTRVTVGTIQYRTQTESQIYLIGVPLGLRYHIWDGRHFGVYASAGGMMESRISSLSTTEYSLDAALYSEPGVQEKKGGARLLWSLKGAVGLTYSLGSHVGLFLEPGVSYYLDKQVLNEATQMTTPLVPSITFGVNVGF